MYIAWASLCYDCIWGVPNSESLKGKHYFKIHMHVYKSNKCHSNVTKVSKGIGLA